MCGRDRYQRDMTDLPRSAALVVNAKSRKGQKMFRTACAKLRENGMELTETHAVRDPSRLDEYVCRAIANGAPMVIVGGGDGSLSARSIISSATTRCSRCSRSARQIRSRARSAFRWISTARSRPSWAAAVAASISA